MTDEELRAIDAQVAEAMGFTRPDTFDHPDYEWELQHDGKWMGWQWISDRTYTDAFWPKHYTTDWAAAGQVVEFLANQEMPYFLRLQEHWTDEWTAAFVHPINEPSFNAEQHGAVAPTAPLAICLAFLKAMGEDAPKA